MDLADVSKYKDENDQTRYLLCMIDCFTRKISVIPTLDKSGPVMLDAVKAALRELGEPERIQCDKGKEFYNKNVQNYLKKREIQLISSENDDVKCAMVERFIRTLRSRIWRFFRHTSSTRYVDRLQDFVYSYNHSKHRSHSFRPVDISQNNSLKVFNSLYLKLLSSNSITSPKYKVGDKVRISKNKLTFEKGCETRFQEPVYSIVRVVRQPQPVYEVKTQKGELVFGLFYETELSLVRGFDSQTFKIDKIIKKRTHRGKKQCLVRWLNYGSEDDQWVDEEWINSST